MGVVLVYFDLCLSLFCVCVLCFLFLLLLLWREKEHKEHKVRQVGEWEESRRKVGIRGRNSTNIN